MVTSRQSHPISYPALPEGAFTALAVREVGPAGAPKPRLLDRVREAIRARHYSRRTEKAYVAWIRRYILFHGKRHPLEMGGPEVTRFLTSLAVEGHVAGSTQNQALSALLFLYREVLAQELPWLDDIVRAKRTARLPVVLTRDEVRAVSMVAHADADTSTTSTFRGRSLNHVTLSVTDVERSQEFYSRLLGGTMSCRSTETDKGAKVESATLDLPDCFIALFKLGEPKVHHFCVGVENFSIDAALEKLKSDFPESKPTVYRGEELYFRDPDGILGQISRDGLSWAAHETMSDAQQGLAPDCLQRVLRSRFRQQVKPSVVRTVSVDTRG